MDLDDRAETRSLKVELTDEEFVERAMELVKCDQRIETLEQERKNSNEEFKRKIGTLLNRKYELHRAIQEVEEFRDIDCEWTENWDQKCWELQRLDNREVIDTRAMSAEDLQGSIQYPRGEATDTSGETNGDDGKKKKRGK